MSYEKGKNYILIGSVIIFGLVFLVSQLENSCSEKRKINMLEKKTKPEINFSLPSANLNEINNKINYINNKDFYLKLYTKPFNQNINSLGYIK